ncbi:hypothetical protein PG910_08850 [Tenacibaculum dicentrarchi]|nr:hypothetical protein PG910_08850 [Tenacibaculum dicentrarchi]
MDKSKDRIIDFWLTRKLNNSEKKEFEKTINTQKNELKSNPNNQTQNIKILKKIEHLINIEGKNHFEKYETCISCSSKESSNLKNNKTEFNYKCNNKDCKIEYGFKDNNIYYNVPNHKEIETNITNTKSDKGDILNAFGYEYI